MATDESETRCEGRYPVPQTSPPREEPFDVTYRCALPKGHDGPHGDGATNGSETRTKEQVYDEDIFPLMQQVLTLCEQHTIPMIAHFAIPTPTDPDLVVTSALLTDRYLAVVGKRHRMNLLAALSMVNDGFVAMLTTARRIGRGAPVIVLALVAVVLLVWLVTYAPHAPAWTGPCCPF